MDLVATTRSVLGRKVRGLRKDGLIPAELYGNGVSNMHLTVQERDFEAAYTEAGESSIVHLVVDGASDKRPVMIHDVQRDPVTGSATAIDFYQVRLDEEIEVSVPVVFTGVSPAVKDFGGVLVKSIQEVDVEALPQNIPHDITVDISVLANIGDAIHVSDLAVSGDVKILMDAKAVVASVIAKMTEEEDAAQAAPIDVTAIKTEKPEKPADEAEAGTEKKEEKKQ